MALRSTVGPQQFDKRALLHLLRGHRASDTRSAHGLTPDMRDETEQKGVSGAVSSRVRVRPATCCAYPPTDATHTNLSSLPPKTTRFHKNQSALDRNGQETTEQSTLTQQTNKHLELSGVQKNIEHLQPPQFEFIHYFQTIQVIATMPWHPPWVTVSGSRILQSWSEGTDVAELVEECRYG